VSSVWVSIVYSSRSSAQETALVFIENVLPIDKSQYNLTLQSFGVTVLPDLGLTSPVNGTQEVLTYSLESKDSSIDVICTIQNNSVYMCSMYVVEGYVIADQPYSGIIDSAKGFLQKYQLQTMMDSTEMINMLMDIDHAENQTLLFDNLKLTILHIDSTGTYFGDSVEFRWEQIFEDCAYLSLVIGFKDGVLSNFIDRRVIYSIGDTSVNISGKQAIAIAMEAAKTYSYYMSNDWVVSSFNITESEVVAVLQTQIIDSAILYPVWSVILPLNGTWPGSVTELLVEVWANSGEVKYIHHQAYGGNSEPPTVTLTQSPIPTPSPISESNDDNTLIDFRIISVVMAIIIITVITTILLIKKRKK